MEIDIEIHIDMKLKQNFLYKSFCYNRYGETDE